MEDYHIHTNFSVCGLHYGGKEYEFSAILEKVLPKLKRAGFCDHVEGFTDSNAFMEITRKRREIAPENVLFGAEVAFITSLGKLSIPDAHAKELDYLIGSVHHIPLYDVFYSCTQELYEKRKNMYGEDKLIKAHSMAVADLAERVNIIGHPFGSFIRLGVYVGDDAVSEFARTIDGKALAEINLRVYRKADKALCIRYLKRMKEEGCRFSLGSDAHSFGELEYDIVEQIKKEAGIKDSDMGRPVD